MGDVAVAQLILPVDYLGRNEDNRRVTALFPETVLPETPPFQVIGKISADDLREIWHVVRDYCKENNIREGILGVEMTKSGDIEVTLGEERGPLDGSGTILEMRTKNGCWIVVSRSHEYWTNSACQFQHQL